MSTQVLVLKIDPEKVIYCDISSEFSGGCNQDKGMDPGLFLSGMGCVITYDNCPIIWKIWLQTEIEFITIEV